MLSLCRYLMRPQRIMSVTAASQWKNRLFNSKLSVRGRRNSASDKWNFVSSSIQKTTSLEELKTVVSMIPDAVEGDNLITCIHHFDRLVGKRRTDPSVADAQVLQTICDKFSNDLNSLDNKQLVELMRIARKLKLDARSHFIPACCRLLTSRLQELDLDQIGTLRYTLCFLEKTDLTNQLHLSLPPVFESLVEKQLDLSDPEACFRALSFALEARVDREKRDFLIDAVEKYIHQAPKWAVYLLKDACIREPVHIDPEDHKMHALMTACLSIIAKNLNTFDANLVIKAMKAYLNLNLVDEELNRALMSSDFSQKWSESSPKDNQISRILLRVRRDKVGVPPTAKEFGSSDKFLSEMLRCNSRKELYDFMNRNPRALEPSYLVSCFVHYKNMLKRGKRSYDSVHYDPAFAILAEQISLHLSSLTPEGCATLIRISRIFKLDPSHPLLRDIIEEFTPRVQELQLYWIIELEENTRRVRRDAERFMLALRCAFESKVEEQLDLTNEYHCLSALRFVLELDSAPHIRKFVFEAARNVLSEVSPDRFLKVFRSIKSPGKFKVFDDPELRELLKDAFAAVARELAHLDAEKRNQIITAYKEVDVFQEEFNDAIWALIPNCTFDEVAACFNKFPDTKMRLKDLDLMKGFLLKNKEEFVDFEHAMVCCRMMALLALRSPESRSELKEIGLRLAVLLAGEQPEETQLDRLCRFVRDLAILGIFPEQEIDYLFRAQHLLPPRTNVTSSFSDLHRLLRLQFGESCKYVLKTEQRPKLTPPAKDLVDCVRAALGGHGFLLESATTPMGIVTGPVAVIDPNGNPIPLEGETSLFENLPEHCHVVTFIQYFKHYFCEDTGMTTLQAALTEYFLRTENIHPVVIKTVDWESLSSEERVPFVKDKIREAVLEGLTEEQHWFERKH